MKKPNRPDPAGARKTPALDATPPSVAARAKNSTLAEGGANARTSSPQFDNFYERGEAAWAEYLRTGISYPADQVFDRIQARTDAKRRDLAVRGS